MTTQAHRELAYEVTYGGDWRDDPSSASEYVRVGTGGETYVRMATAAQAFALLEAKVAHKTWNEGCSAGNIRVNFAIGGSAPVNPYPKV